MDSARFLKEQLHALRSETDSATGVTYVAKAAPGTADGAAAWQIQKITVTTVGTVETVVLKFPNGDNRYAFVWNDRASYTYA